MLLKHRRLKATVQECFVYDPVSNLVAVNQPAPWGAAGAGQLTGYSPPGLGLWQLDYDAAGRPITQTDPLKRATHTTWDAYDQQQAIIDPAGGAQTFVYDEQGRLTALTNANGEATRFTYDHRDRLIEQVGFDGRRQSFRYNPAGEITERIDHGTDGQITTTLVYDVLGRPIERQTSDGSQWRYRYDERGLLTQAQAIAPHQAPVQVTYEYDAAGRRIAEVQSHHGRVWRLTHTLDAIGNRERTQLPQAGALTWQRYGSGHVHGILLDTTPLANFERDALHREVQRTQGLVTHHFDYAASGHVSRHQWQNINDTGQALEAPRPWRSWAYDWAGQLTTLADAQRGQKTYQYDPLSRLAGVSGAAQEAFRYDPAGNLLGIARSRGEILAWQARGDRLARFAPPAHPANPLDFTYDGHGNRIGRTLTGTQAPHSDRYQYDGSHQLIAIEHAEGQHTRYQYDALGRRVAKHRTYPNGSTTSTLFVWDGDWMVQEVAPGRTGHTDTATTYIPHPNHAGPLARVTPSSIEHYVTDHLGSPQEMYDDQRKLVWVADFSAYGRMTKLIANETSNPIRFPGQYYDEESGLHYNRFRYYDPQTGRYINQDPISLAGGTNLYAYVDGNPIIYMDPEGLVRIYDDGNVSMHSYPGKQEGGKTEHARHGPGENYHIHLYDSQGREARISTETWKPLTPEDEKIYNRSKAMQRACNNLSDGEKKFLDRVNRQIFHTGAPTVKQLLRIGQIRGGVGRMVIVPRGGNE